MDWQTVKKRTRSHLSGEKCRALEEQHRIRYLGKCLLSPESKQLQQDGYQFYGVSNAEDLPGNLTTLKELQDNHRIQGFKALEVPNEWHDHALFTLPVLTSSPPTVGVKPAVPSKTPSKVEHDW